MEMNECMNDRVSEWILIKMWMNEWMHWLKSEEAKAQISEHLKLRMSTHAKDWMGESLGKPWFKDQLSEWTYEWMNEWMKEHPYKQVHMSEDIVNAETVKEWMSECTNPFMV